MGDIFEPDEQTLNKVDRNWSVDQLLAQEGLFFLKDVVSLLDIDPTLVKRKVRELRDQGFNPWEEAGIRKVWNHWVVRMSVFRHYYRRHLVCKYKKLNPMWDGNLLLQQEGRFLLADVVKLIPFTSHQIRYQAKLHENSREAIGVYKDDSHYVVEMRTFAAWIKSVWRAGTAS